MYEFVVAGGWLMLPILLCSIAAAAICVERFWSLSPSKIAPANLIAQVWIWLKNDDFDADTGLDVGIRYKYANLRSLLSIEKLGEIIGEPVYLEGPHENEIKYNSEEEFGHYNPAFLTKVKSGKKKK